MGIPAAVAAGSKAASAATAVSGLMQGAGGLTAGISMSVARHKAREALNALGVPPTEAWKYEAYLLENPDMIESILQGNTNLENIIEDPLLRESQIGGLEYLSDVIANGGYTPTELGQIQQIGMQTGTQARGMREALDTQANRRGIGGSGFDLASQISANQAAANMSSQQGFDVAREGQRRGLEAVLSKAELGGKIRGQEWGQQAQTKSAQDIIDQFNVANRMRSQELNQQAKMQTALANQAVINQKRKDDAEAEKAVWDARMTAAAAGAKI